VKSKIWTLLTLFVVASLVVLAGCTTPTPEVIEKIVTEVVKEVVKETVIVEGTPQVVEKEVTKVIEKEVTTVVEKEVVVTATPEPKGQVEVVIFVGFGTGTSAEQIAIHEAIADEYNATHDDIQVRFLTTPWEERQSKFATLLAADTPPDICMPIGVGGVSGNYEAWEDIGPYIDRDAYDLDRFFGTAVDLHTHPGKGVLGLPIGVFPTVIFYNEDLFDAAGVDYPPHEFEAPYADGDPWTYDKLVEIAKLLTIDASGNNADSPAFNWEETVQWGWNGWDWMTFKEFPQKWGGSNVGVSEDYKTAEMNTEAWVETMEWNKDTIWTWHIRATGEQAGAFYDVAGDPMGSGMVAMWECHSWMAWAYASWTEAFNWDVAAVPAVEGYPVMAPMHADTFVMLRAAHHKDEAWEVMKWMFEPDILDRLAKNYGSIPADKDLAAGWVDSMNADFPDVDFQVFLDSIAYLDDPQHEKWTPEFQRIYDAVDVARDTIGSGENINVQEVMDNLNAEVQGYLDEYWASQ